MEPKGSLPHAQVPATCPYPETTWSSPYSTSWRSILILSSQLHLGLPSDRLPSGFPTKTLYALLLCPICVTCPTHLILLDFITRRILGEQYRSLSSSLCSLLISLVTPSLLGPNILLNTLFPGCCCKWTCPQQAPNIPRTKFMSLFCCLCHTKVSIQVWGKCSCFVTNPVFMGRSCQQLTHPQAGGPPLVGCLRLLIQYICSYLPYCLYLNTVNIIYNRTQYTLPCKLRLLCLHA